MAEYQRFVNNNGYGDSEYWDKEWWSKKEKQGWTEPGRWDEQTEHQNYPVTEVSWYEASAYCKWLTAQTKRPYRLPREKEWKDAATNPNGEYPWGNDDPNPELLNFYKNVGNPTPVGIYPAGAAAGGHLDMAGNVWEWNLDSYEGGSYRVLRGGSWLIGPKVRAVCGSQQGHAGRPQRRPGFPACPAPRSVAGRRPRSVGFAWNGARRLRQPLFRLR